MHFATDNSQNDINKSTYNKKYLKKKQTKTNKKTNHQFLSCLPRTHFIYNQINAHGAAVEKQTSSVNTVIVKKAKSI